MAAAKTVSISKIDAVRQAIKELGKGAMPGKIQEFVKKTFGLEMSTGYVSVYKSQILKGKKPAPVKAVPVPVKTAPATPVSVNAVPAKAAPTKPAPVRTILSNGSTVSLGDIAVVKELVGRVGESNLTSLIGLLG